MSLRTVLSRSLIAFVLCGGFPSGSQSLIAADNPPLPEQDAAVEIAAQEWPQRPGPRTVRVLVHFPGGKLSQVNRQTGLMLTLHNWGGTDCVGTANPRELAQRLNVVAICVNYLQSGPKDSIEGPEPYDFGYLQSLDALRALHFVFAGLRERKIEFHSGRIFATGGSGGGNVTLMANKLAPRTFACVVDLCGMKKLSDDIAFKLPGGSDLDARYSRDPRSRNFLSGDEQELRFIGHPEHLATMKRLGNSSKIVVVHGVDDVTCPYADAVEMVEHMQRAKLDVEPRWVTKNDVDGQTFTSTGHSLGNRTAIVFATAGRYLTPDSPTAIVRSGPTDFERQDEVQYRTARGLFSISYAAGFPVGKFTPSPPPVKYVDHQQLTYWLDRDGQRHDVKSVADWQRRREHIVENFSLVTGDFPNALRRVPLDVRVSGEAKQGEVVRRSLSFQSDPTDRVSAYLLIPPHEPGKRLPAMLCLHQTTKSGKDEPSGVRGDTGLGYAAELAARGFVCLVPDYPSFGEHKYDFAPTHGYASGTMKAVWDNVRAVDLLQSLDFVDADRIGCIGHSLGGHNAIFTAVFEPRIKAIVSSCGFSSMTKDDVPSWTGIVYMPRIASEFGNDVKKLPFDFHELIGALAPRPFLACAADRDDDFDVSGVRDVLAAAKPIYDLHPQAGELAGYYPAARHSFPQDARTKAYEFLDRALRR